MPLPQLQGVPFGSARDTPLLFILLYLPVQRKTSSSFTIKYTVKHSDFLKEKSNHLGFAEGDNEHTKTIQCNTSEKFKNTHGSLGEALSNMSHQRVLKKPNSHRMKEKNYLEIITDQQT